MGIDKLSPLLGLYNIGSMILWATWAFNSKLTMRSFAFFSNRKVLQNGEMIIIV